jgi:peptide/nickel transport system substrate-binding protein
MLQTGEVDLIFNIAPHAVKRLQRMKNLRVKSAVVPSYHGIGFNCVGHPEIFDRNLRLAMNYAINRQQIVDRIFFGHAYPLYTFGSRAEFGFDPSIQYPYDPEKARELVKQSSYKPGTPIDLIYAGNMPNSTEVLGAVQDSLKEVGVTIKLVKMEPVMASTMIRKKDPKIMMWGSVWPGRQNPSMRLGLGVKKGAMYSLYYGRDDVDQLIVEQEGTFDGKKRAQLINKIHRILKDDPAYIPLFGLNMLYATTDRIEYNWVKNYNRLVNLEEIKILK